MSFILDCSVAATWCCADEASAASDALLDRLADQGAIVPALWYLEIANVLAQAERRGRITAGDLAAARRGLPLATRDHGRRRAAERLGTGLRAA